MEYIEKHLYLFCEKDNLELCLSVLRNKLKKENQMSMYDNIYDIFIQDKIPEQFDENMTIKNLNQIVKLIVLSRIYKSQLYPKLAEEELISLKEKTNEQIRKSYCDNEILDFKRINFYIEILNDTNYSFRKLIYTILKIFINDRNEVFNKLTYFEQYSNYPKNHFCFPYILIHNACNLGFESLSNMLFGNRKYTKLPLGLKLFCENTGPHSGIHNTPYRFFSHDLSHINHVLRNISISNMEIIFDFLKHLPKLTFERRVIDIYLISIYFENVIEYIISLKAPKNNDYDISNPFIHMHMFEEIIFSFSDNDVKHVFYYLFTSTDISKYVTNFEKLKIFIIEYKNRNILIDKLYKIYSYFKYKSFSSIDMSNVHLFLEMEDYNENDNRKIIGEKITLQRKKNEAKLKEFFDECISKMMYVIIPRL